VKARISSWNRQSTLGDIPLRDAAQVEPITAFDNAFSTSAPTAALLSYTIPREAQIDEALQSLVDLRILSAKLPWLFSAINELYTFLESMKDISDFEDSHRRSARLQPLKAMLFWFPNRFIHSLNTHPAVMILMAHLHATALFIDPVSDNKSANFRSINAAPIQAFYEEISMRADIEIQSGQSDGLYMSAVPLMGFPCRTKAAFKCSNFYDDTDHSSAANMVLMPCPAGKYQKLSMLQILEDFPVGLWHTSLSGPEND